jgi:hypothetical protein
MRVKVEVKIGSLGAGAGNTAGIPEGNYSQGDTFFCDEKALEHLGDYVEVVKTFPTKTIKKKVVKEVPEEKDAKKYPPKDTPDY